MEKARILIVEDEPIIAMEVKNQIQSLGYEVTSIVDTGEKAIKKAEADKPDLILMDIQIKDKIDGIKAADIIHTRFNIPVVFATAYTDEKYLEKAKLTHPYGYLIKPYQELDLKVVLSIALYVADLDRKREAAEEALKKAHNELEKKIEERTAELRKHYQAAEHSGSVIIITDFKGNIEYVNPSFSIITGYSKEEVIGKNPRILKSNQHPPEFYKDMWGVISNGNTWRGEIVNKKKNNELYWEYTTISPILDTSSKIINYVAVNDDISDRKQLENDLIKAKNEAELANKAKSEFLSNMSHEIRTPMHQILSFSQLGVSKFDKVNSEKLLHYFLKIGAVGKQLMSLLDNILDLSNLDSGKMAYKFQNVNFKYLINSLIKEFDSVKNKKGVTLEISEMMVSTEIVCDEYKIRQVVYNLLSNAIKFTPKGKKIYISIKQSQDEAPVPALYIRVSDQGIGIPEAELITVFYKFIQSSKTKTGAGGTGLGLAICKEIIEAHKGKIWAENNPEGGATFSFMLPFEQEVK
ncbi:MAG: response regulator [Deltaproteobacteria bacterium]|jgi:PAS domain S-box-containing protein|nr:response regulator [Deltaproteobacteria bacterium]